MFTKQHGVESGDTDVFLSVIGSVDWVQETMLSAILITLYATCILLTVLSWTKTYFMWGVFCLLCVAVYSAKWINEVAARNYKIISDENQFFDSAGLFISIVYSFPLIINLIILLLRMLYVTSNEMIEVKKLKLRSSLRDKKND